MGPHICKGYGGWPWGKFHFSSELDQFRCSGERPGGTISNYSESLCQCLFDELTNSVDNRSARAHCKTSEPDKVYQISPGSNPSQRRDPWLRLSTLSLASKENVRTTTLKLFGEAEFDKIVAA